MGHAFFIEPNTYIAFEDEAEQIEKCKEWSLLSEKASKTKTFYYKGGGVNLPCSIIGYVDSMIAVIQFDNNQLHCIHPSYLKEMQASNYGQRQSFSADKSAETTEGGESESQQQDDVLSVDDSRLDEPKIEEVKVTAVKAEAPKAEAPREEGPTAAEAPKGKSKRAPKLQLPEAKVKMIATVQEFTTVPNHFAEEDDEVVIYESVFIKEDPETEVGLAWSSHSATLKKQELEIGDIITFEAKIAAKKLTKHPVPYKINNPSKIQKVES
ncbi:hypothetical protein [Paenibacillus spongiae]|uniref:Uncharacterized protein n=1 Tax=Paenibacillus spongiae TaxID=2909671 RepID=A0ABY5SB13_9BACL|nr:hypothetical protein [Paenibacillus spongiae]UVI29488.1 hypothetical protein L1F29_29395 [Paenibacillus spongiae]